MASQNIGEQKNIPLAEEFQKLSVNKQQYQKQIPQEIKLIDLFYQFIEESNPLLKELILEGLSQVINLDESQNTNSQLCGILGDVSLKLSRALRQIVKLVIKQMSEERMADLEQYVEYHFFLHQDQILPDAQQKKTSQIILSCVYKLFKLDQSKFNTLLQKLHSYLHLDILQQTQTNEYKIKIDLMQPIYYLLLNIMTFKNTNLPHKYPRLLFIHRHSIRLYNENYEFNQLWILRTLKYIKNNPQFDQNLNLVVNSGVQEKILPDIYITLLQILYQKEYSLKTRIFLLEQVSKIIKQSIEIFPFKFIDDILKIDPISFFNDKAILEYEDIQYFKTYWNLIYRVHQTYMNSLLQNNDTTTKNKNLNIRSIYDYEGVFENSKGKTQVITKIGITKRWAQSLNQSLQSRLFLINHYSIFVPQQLSNLFFGKKSKPTKNLLNFYIETIYLPKIKNKDRFTPLQQFLLNQNKMNLWMTINCSEQYIYMTDDTFNHLLLNLYKTSSLIRIYCQDLYNLLLSIKNSPKTMVSNQQLLCFQVPLEMENFQAQILSLIMQKDFNQSECLNKLLQFMLYTLNKEKSQSQKQKQLMKQISISFENQFLQQFMKAFVFQNLQQDSTIELYQYFLQSFEDQQYIYAAGSLNLISLVEGLLQTTVLVQFANFFQKNIVEILYVFGFHKTQIIIKNQSLEHSLEAKFKVSISRSLLLQNSIIPFLNCLQKSLLMQEYYLYETQLQGILRTPLLQDSDQLSDIMVEIFNYEHDNYQLEVFRIKQLSLDILIILNKLNSSNSLEKLTIKLFKKNLSLLQNNLIVDDCYIILLNRLMNHKDMRDIFFLQIDQIPFESLLNQPKVLFIPIQEIFNSKRLIIFEMILNIIEYRQKERLIDYMDQMQSLQKFFLSQSNLLDQEKNVIQYLTIKSSLQYQIKNHNIEDLNQGIDNPTIILINIIILYFQQESFLIKTYLINLVLNEFHFFGLNCIPFLCIILCDKDSYIRKRVKQFRQQFQTYLNQLDDIIFLNCFNFLVYFIELQRFEIHNNPKLTIIIYWISQFCVFISPQGSKLQKKQSECYMQLILICETLQQCTPITSKIKGQEIQSLPQERSLKFQGLFDQLIKQLDTQIKHQRDQLFNFLKQILNSLYKAERKKFQELMLNPQSKLSCIDNNLYFLKKNPSSQNSKQSQLIQSKFQKSKCQNQQINQQDSKKKQNESNTTKLN